MASSFLQQLSQATGLAYCPKQGPFGHNDGAVIGQKDGYLVAIGPAVVNNQKSIAVMVLFPEFSEPDRLRGLLESSASLAAALETDQIKDKHLKKAEILTDSIIWRWEYTFGKPKPEKVVALMEALVGALKGTVPHFEGRCGNCRQSSASEILLINGTVPTYICDGCRFKAQGEVDEVTRAYENIEPNLMRGLLFAVPVAVAFSFAWGLIAYAIERIFLWGGVLIGVGVTKALIKGMGRINVAGQACAVLLTVGSVLLGDAIFYTLAIMKTENLQFSMELFSSVMAHFWEIELENGIVSILVALGGAAYVLFTVARPPKFSVEYVPLKPEIPKLG